MYHGRVSDTDDAGRMIEDGEIERRGRGGGRENISRNRIPKETIEGIVTGK